MKIILIFILAWLVNLIQSGKVNAIYDPLSVPNNKIGIHIIDENDLENAALLVNSSGGDWGYVTIVLPDYDRDTKKWQTILNKMNDLHLIPLIRIATHPEGNFWVKPDRSQANGWADFLGELNWFSRNRYIILFNEPNHAKEWGNSISPQEYADVLENFSKKLKEKSPDFFVLPAGFDASAPDEEYTMDEKAYLAQMVSHKKDIFSNIDGWTSHSYPNPAFRGSTDAWGKGTIRTYIWERQYLKQLGIIRNLPIFITETGWMNTDSRIENFMNYALNNIWNDPYIVAVTPFVLNYQAFPFINFSWQKLGKSELYSHYDVYRAFPKIPGKPLFNLIDMSPLYRSFNHLSEFNNQLSSFKDFENLKFFSIRRTFVSLFHKVFNL